MQEALALICSLSTASNFLFMQGQEPMFALQAASCSCMHFGQLFPPPANKRDVTAGPVLALFYLISTDGNLSEQAGFWHSTLLLLQGLK